MSNEGILDWIQDIESLISEVWQMDICMYKIKKREAHMPGLADSVEGIYNLAFWPERATVHLIRPLGLL